MTTAKSNVFIFFIGLTWLLVGRGGGWANFWMVGEGDTTPILPSSVYLSKYIYIYIYIYIKELCQQVFIYNEEAPCTAHASCAKVAILLLQDLSTLCLTDIYGICFHVSVQLQ